MALAEKHYHNVNNLYDVGMASKFDLLRSEVQLANLKPQLIRARNSSKRPHSGLKTLLGLDFAQAVEFKGELSFQAPRSQRGRRWPSPGPPARSQQIHYPEAMAAEMVKMAKAAYLPTVAVGGDYNYWADNFNFRNKTWESFYPSTSS